MGPHQVVVDQGADGLAGQALDLVDLVGGAEAVEEVQEGIRPARVAAWAMRAKSMTSCTEAEQSMAKPVVAAGHDVGVIAEDRQGLGGQGARRDMHDRRRQFAGDLVHVGDHQQQALGGGEGGGQRPGLQGAVDGPGRAGLALHLDHLGHRAPEIGVP